MIKLSQLLHALAASPEAPLTFRLPDGSTVPAHFHITEVGRVRKDFIDCGGTVRSTERCVLQVWSTNDADHRVSAGKVARIISMAERLLGETDLDVEVEYDVGVITQLPIESIDVTDTGLHILLGGKHTACLAPDRCGVPDPSGNASGCCSSEPSSAPALVPLGVRR